MNKARPSFNQIFGDLRGRTWYRDGNNSLAENKSLTWLLINMDPWAGQFVAAANISAVAMVLLLAFERGISMEEIERERQYLAQFYTDEGGE